MTNLSAPVLDRQVVNDCDCFTGDPPMPMGCALCGHPPYAHGCPGRPADHDYAQPSGTLIAERLETRHRLGPHQLPRFTPPATVAPGEVIPLVPAQRRPDPPPAAPAVPTPTPLPLPMPKRAPRPVRRVAPRPAATMPPRRDDGRRPGPRCTRVAVSRAHGTRFAPSRHRSPTPYGGPNPFLSPVSRTRPSPPTTGRALDRTQEVRPVEHLKSTAPASAIPGWRVIRSDAGRFWASRERPFPDGSMWDGPPFRTVDADTFDQLQAEVTRQEEAARGVDS
ncbi:hypothetical protein ACQPYK_47130 [Streptosporangium sp. CA-135522]|uniref:hypothetical protein n=1 Tax=Streptosporangium sp. CA-135522 TaxID=3240072 RepID=UPI003D90D033